MDLFGTETKKKVSKLEKVNEDLINRTAILTADNQKMNSLFTSAINYGLEAFTGETNKGDLPEINDLIIYYDDLRMRSWQFILKNHIAKLMVTKRVDWMIGSGLLFNSKPSDKPFIEMFGEKKGKEKYNEFVSSVEYQYRNLIKTKIVDYSNECNLHEIARKIDYNAQGDGDVFLLMRVKNGYPNIQSISGQSITDPFNYDIPRGHTVNNGVEKNKNDKVVAYHILIDHDQSNGTYGPITENIEYGTKRIPVNFPGTNFKQAWLYSASDLRKLGETRGMPTLSDKFESLQHVNDYIIANAKNAQLRAQLVVAFEKDGNSDGTKMFEDSSLDNLNMAAPTTTTNVATDLEVQANAVKATQLMQGNGIVVDGGRGVKTKVINDTSQSDQKEYLDSTLRTIFASDGHPYEVMLSSYDSNYSASMGARSDYQHNLDVITEIIPSAQLYKMHYNMFLYLQIQKGDIICEPLRKAYIDNDIIAIQALGNSTFEGTKLKPIDPLKFIKALRAQLPENVREKVALNTIDNLVNMASNGDFQGITKQIASEIALLPEEFDEPEPEPIIKTKP